MIFKRLTDNCYLVSDSWGNKLGMTFHRGDLILFTHDSEVYSTFDEIASKFNETWQIVELSSVEIQKKEIDGFPVRHIEFFEKEVENELIFYKTREGSQVRFVAGFWVVSTDSVNRVVLSPKEGTLSEGSLGPFKSRFDANAELSRLNRESQ